MRRSSFFKTRHIVDPRDRTEIVIPHSIVCYNQQVLNPPLYQCLDIIMPCTGIVEEFVIKAAVLQLPDNMNFVRGRLDAIGIDGSSISKTFSITKDVTAVMLQGFAVHKFDNIRMFLSAPSIQEDPDSVFAISGVAISLCIQAHINKEGKVVAEGTNTNNNE